MKTPFFILRFAVIMAVSVGVIVNPAHGQVANAPAGVQTNQNDRLPPASAPAWSNAETNLNTMAPSAGNGRPSVAEAPGITGQVNPGMGAYGGTLGGTPPPTPAVNPDATIRANR